MAGVCTGPGPCDTSPNGPGPNWVTEVGELPPYIRAIMHALRRNGMSEQQAAATAVATVQHWKNGGGKVSDATRARAAKAVAEWEELRAKAHSRSSSGTRQFAGAVTESSSAGDLLPVGPSAKQAEAIVEKEKRDRHRQAMPHPFRGKDVKRCTLCGRNATDKVHLGEDKRALANVDARYVIQGDVAKAGEAIIPRPHDYEEDGSGKCTVCGDVPEFWVHGTRSGMGYRSRRLASKAAFDQDCDAVEPLIAAAMVTLFERQERATLSRLSGKRGRQALRRSAEPKTGCGCCPDCKMDESAGWTGCGCCDGCKPASEPGGARAGERAGPANPQGIQPTAPAQPHPAVAATLPGVAAPVAVVGPAAAALAGFPPAIAAQAIALATAVFDVAFWTATTAGILMGVYAAAHDRAVARVDSEIGLNATAAEAAKAAEQTTTPRTTAAKAEDIAEEQASATQAEVGAEGSAFDIVPGEPEPEPEPMPSGPMTAADVLRVRANRMAATVTETTFRQIAEALADGLDHGESQGQLANDVRDVFAASRARAELIARTETIGALNEAANAQAEWLGPDHVARKEWLAHHDNRTRPTHRMADGQTVPIGHPFIVGQSLMQHPGDPTAPANEVCNCRCALAFLPPGAERIPR